MTNKEALKILKSCYPNSSGIIDDAIQEAFDMAIEELEKQIPNKPLDVDEDNGLFDCPVCKTRIYADNIRDFKYCLNCGKKLDWGEQNDE